MSTCPIALTDKQVERIRLLLSTYQDGTGMLAVGGATLPGWRDFERSTAIALAGIAQESKALFDVVVPLPGEGIGFGISCKMRRELGKVRREGCGRVSMEISNSSGKFWGRLAEFGITPDNYRAKEPAEVGRHLVDLIESWSDQEDSRNGGNIALDRSYFLSLSWDGKGAYQLHQFDIHLPDPANLIWSFPKASNGTESRRLSASDKKGVLIEWYGESGGQFKYYPLVSDALWCSLEFSLEPLPNSAAQGIESRAALYFPDKWDASQDE